MEHRPSSVIVPGVAALLLVSGALAAGCAGGAGDSGDWYYHWDCHGDSECLTLNPTGASSGTSNEGPVEVNCTQVMEFGRRFWNIPPATQSCDHSPNTPVPPPPVPTLVTFVPTSGIQGSSVTVSGGGFPALASAITVSLGGVTAVVTGVTSNQVVFTMPALPPGSYPITINTAGGSATSSASFALRNPILTVNTSGQGSVASVPAGISCTSGTGTCTASFPFGSVVGLTETAAASAHFDGWMGGDCSGTGTSCSVTLNADLTVTASFLSETLTVVVTGSGNVVSTPPGIDCSGRFTACTAAFAPGTVVTLTETPGAVASFGGWSGGGCDPASSTCTLTLSDNVTIQAPFLTFTLTVVPVAVNGTAGTGTITSVPAGIDCAGAPASGAGCSAAFAGGTQVTLAVALPADSSFAGWVGAGCAGSGPCTVTLSSDTTVTGQYCVPHATLSFATPGSFTHVACADALSVQVWGAGGGGGAESDVFGRGSGSGGGGGGYGSASVGVTAGSSYVVTVGAGGRGGWGYDHGTPNPAQVPCSGGASGPGVNGGGSDFGALIAATGGGGGSYGPSAGGAGGTSNAATVVPGSAGQVGGSQQSSLGGAGGAGGNGGTGGAGGVGVPYDTQPPAGTSPNGTAGTPPGGGGGGGAWNNFFCYDGGAGANGQVVVSW